VKPTKTASRSSAKTKPKPEQELSVSVKNYVIEAYNELFDLIQDEKKELKKLITKTAKKINGRLDDLDYRIDSLEESVADGTADIVSLKEDVSKLKAEVTDCHRASNNAIERVNSVLNEKPDSSGTEKSPFGRVAEQSELGLPPVVFRG
jgi:chromosome segregation ATPase